MKAKRLIPLLAAGAAALAVPAGAGAATYCVGDPACPADGQPSAGLQEALFATAASPEDDLLLLGSAGSPYIGPFSYVPPTLGREPNRLSIQGSGIRRPLLTAPAGDTVLLLRGGSIDDVDIRMGTPGEGIGLEISDGHVGDIVVSSPPGSPGGIAIRAGGATTLDGTRVTAPTDLSLSANSNSLTTVGSSVVATGVRLENAQIGASVGAKAGLVLSGSRISAAGSGIQAFGGGSAVVSRSSIAVSGPAAKGASVVDAELRLDHVTVAHRGGEAGSGDIALNLFGDDSPGRATLDSVALAGFSRGIQVLLDGQFFPVIARNSVWDASNDLFEGDPLFEDTGNANVEPALVDLVGGDLRPAAGSALIDRDPSTDPAGYVDLDGVAAFDGDGDGAARPDAGAFERAVPAAPPAPPAPPAPAPGGGELPPPGAGELPTGGATPGTDTTVPILSGVKLSRARARIGQAGRLRLRFKVSEAARLRVVPARVVGSRVLRARGAIVRSVAPGAGTIALARSLRKLGVLKPGRVRLVVSAVDSAGNRSGRRVLTLRLTR